MASIDTHKENKSSKDAWNGAISLFIFCKGWYNAIAKTTSYKFYKNFCT